MLSLIEKIDGGNLFYLVLILHFVVFNLSKNFLVSRPFFGARRTAKLQHFFELPKHFKKIFYFSFKLLLFCFAGNLSRLRMQRYNIFSNYQNIFKLFLKLFYKLLYFKKKNFNLSVFFMLKNMFFTFFQGFFCHF